MILPRHLVVCAVVGFAAILSGAVPLHEKKSTHDLNEFTMALNGASRLRYGKRSGGLFDPSADDQFIPEQFDSFPVYMGQQKRTRSIYSDPLALKLVQSLNGAERLRFGRR
ncbi:hypothetical protein QR680_005326 [Steinernema hermaphroditum]|uniref:Uncharacterized protein n=1 Tax=Steinernema hermaphroditum TaxID=289476 RepID=A0AA39HRL6_9BILA|nr:hypothetical protein QR680_005326 [Steinernema hermaphroditum]